MASDNWHHLEGVYPKAGAFRMYFYDDFTKPLPRDQMRAVAAEVVANGRTFPLTSMQQPQIPRGQDSWCRASGDHAGSCPFHQG